MRQILAQCYAVEVAERRMRYQSTPEIEAILTKVTNWLCSQSEVRKPGLMLVGRFGNGKTTMARAICRLVSVLYNRNVWAMNASDIVELQLKDADRFGNFKTATQIFIDDLGMEPVEVKDFGTIKAPLINILYHRYEAMKFTICTTNEDDAGLKSKYGDRIADRLNEMFNRFAFEAPSFRK